MGYSLLKVRGVAFGTPRNDYACGDVGQKLREANERTLVIALIETAAGIAGCQGESRGSIYTCSG
jgi:hypothetical protein